MMRIGSKKKIEPCYTRFDRYCDAGLENARKITGGQEFLGHLYAGRIVGIRHLGDNSRSVILRALVNAPGKI